MQICKYILNEMHLFDLCFGFCNELIISFFNVVVKWNIVVLTSRRIEVFVS